MKKNRLLIMMCLLICGLSSAQELPNKCEVSLPEYLFDTEKAQSDWTKSQKWQDWAIAKIKNNDFGKKNNKVWKVYSDRANNKTYQKPDASSTHHSTLNFMDQLKVADIRNGFALLYKSNYAGSALAIPDDAECLGWIPVDNLLLWDECPKTHRKIYQKALIVHDPAKHISSAEQNPPFLLEPDRKAGKNPRQRAKDLDIYFVMKTANFGNSKYYLLSTKILIGNSIETVYGWMPEEYVTEWNQRLMVEPAYASKTVSYYKNKNLYPTIFYKIENAQQFWTNEVTHEQLWQYRDFDAKRMHPYQ